MNFHRALVSLDVSLFDHVRMQAAPRDRLSLLALHNACREAYGRFHYLEIGSHRGGSLQVMLRDERCVAAVSIDPRPEVVPDDLYTEVRYRGNTTERMLEDLSAVPGIDLAKLTTIEASTADLSPDAIPFSPQLCYIDAEHTYRAALRDARFCRQMMKDGGAIAFHDYAVVRPAIDEFLQELTDVAHEAYELPRALFVVEWGETRLAPIARPLLQKALDDLRARRSAEEPKPPG